MNPSTIFLNVQYTHFGIVGISRRQGYFVENLSLSTFYLFQIHITISPEKVKLTVDCQEVAEKPIKEANNITLEGYEVLGKMVKSSGSKKTSATVRAKEAKLVKNAKVTSGRGSHSVENNEHLKSARH